MMIKKQYTEVFEQYKKDFIFPKNLDNNIVDLITEINKFEDIVTAWSCSGHPPKDYGAYICFSISEDIWDKFWLDLVPKLCVNAGMGFKIEISLACHMWPLIGLYFRSVHPTIDGYELFVTKSLENFWKYFKKELIDFLKKNNKR